MNLQKKFLLKSAALVLSVLVYAEAYAGVQFLPNGGAAKNVRNKQGNPCMGYNLSKPKCENMACAAGWNCASCTNARGTFYKCTQYKCESGYAAGKTSCASCQQYAYNGFAGNQICGKCENISNCLTSASSDDYTSFEYVNSVTISGKNVIENKKTAYKPKN